MGRGDGVGGRGSVRGMRMLMLMRGMARRSESVCGGRCGRGRGLWSLISAHLSRRGKRRSWTLLLDRKGWDVEVLFRRRLVEAAAVHEVLAWFVLYSLQKALKLLGVR